jgi:hypothetical protein
MCKNMNISYLSRFYKCIFVWEVTQLLSVLVTFPPPSVTRTTEEVRQTYRPIRIHTVAANE